MNRTRALILILLILIIATGLRIYRLDEGLWLDEYLTYLKYARLPIAEIITTFESENQHFLYSILAHLSFQLFGESGWALRLPAVFFGVGSILAVYLLGIEVANSREGLLAAALLTFSYHHVWFSQNARGYTGLLFWTLLSSYLLLRGLRDNRGRIWILYALSVALGVYTHLTMLFVVFGQLMVFMADHLLQRRNKFAEWKSGLFLGFGMAGVLTLIMHAPVLSAMSSTIGGSEASVVTEWKNPLWTLREFIVGLNVSFSAGIFALAALFGFGAGLVSYWRTNYKVVLLFLIPPFIGSVFTIAIGHHLWPRFFFFALGFAALIIVRGAMVIASIISRVLRLPPGREELIGTLLNLGIIIVSGLSLLMVYGPKQDFAGAIDFIQSNLNPGDTVVTVSLTTMVYQDFYHTGWRSVKDIAELNEIRANANRTWIVYTFKPVLTAVYPEIMESIQRDFTVVAQFPGTVREGTIVIARSEPSQIALFCAKKIILRNPN